MLLYIPGVLFCLCIVSQLSAAVTTDVLAVKAAVQGNLQRDRGLRAVLETVFGLGVLLKLSPRLAWVFAVVIPIAAWGLVRASERERGTEGESYEEKIMNNENVF